MLPHKIMITPYDKVSYFGFKFDWKSTYKIRHFSSNLDRKYTYYFWIEMKNFGVILPSLSPPVKPPL